VPERPDCDTCVVVNQLARILPQDLPGVSRHQRQVTFTGNKGGVNIRELTGTVTPHRNRRIAIFIPVPHPTRRGDLLELDSPGDELSPPHRDGRPRTPGGRRQLRGQDSDPARTSPQLPYT
jgi:hypothetical protein